MKQWLKYALVAVISAALGGAAAWGVADRRQPEVEVEAAMAPEAGGDSLAAFETQRQQLRAREQAQLNDIIHDDVTDARTLADAQRRLMALLDESSAEETLQANLRARGFEGAVVSVWSSGVNVFVRSEGLNRQQSAVILDEVLRETGKTGGNVKIIPINSPKVFAQ